MRRGVRTSGRLDPNTVWERYAVPNVWSSWSPQIRGVEASGPRIVDGMTGLVHGPVGVLISFEVLRVDEVRRWWSWRVHAGPVVLRLEHEVLVRPDGGSDTTLEVDGPALVVLAYLPLARIALRNLVTT
ncbi:hypothetical protein [Lapillicoccus sp.]|uniref:hypothetical protein n=1 Tax=Lapillicoccus sp. TaxID=1909287 RepID=UPI003265764B